MGSATKATPRTSQKASIATQPPAIDFRDVASDFGITTPNFYGGERTRHQAD